MFTLLLRVTRPKPLPRLAGFCRSVLNLVAPTGYEDAAGFHVGEIHKAVARSKKMYR